MMMWVLCEERDLDWTGPHAAECDFSGSFHG
jgi:hypothetical protein